MPIRFACPHCYQKLSVSSRKAGSAADCPRCRQKLMIPVPPPEPVREPPARPAPLPASAPQQESAPPPFPFSSIAPEPAAEAPATAHESAEAPAAATALAEPPPLAEDAVWTPDPAGFDGMELVYDNTEPPSAPSSGAENLELVAIPRYVLYLQGGLIGVVALVAFAIGVLTGGALLTQPSAPAAPQACLLRGSVMFASGPRQLPDEGAVIAVIPQTETRPDDKAPVTGLRPDDPTPDDSHRGIAVLKELGGGYTRADASGHFELRLPNRGRYMVLVISNQARVRSVEEIQTGDILKLGPYFDSAADLLGDHRYQLTMEPVRGDHDLPVAFD